MNEQISKRQNEERKDQKFYQQPTGQEERIRNGRKEQGERKERKPTAR
jgi:hypothetical protein